MHYVKNSAGSKRRSKRSRARKRAALCALVVATLAFIAAILTRPRPAAPPRPPMAHTAATPGPRVVLEPARPWTAAQRSDLRGALAQAFQGALGGADGWSLIVLSQDGKTVFDDDGDRAVTPASVQSLS